MNAGADLVFGPHARAAGCDTCRATRAHGSRTRHDHGMNALPGLRVQRHIAGAGLDRAVLQQGTHLGHGCIAAKPTLANQVARHRDADGGTHATARAGGNGHRQSRHSGRDASLIQGIQAHGLGARDLAVADQCIDAAHQAVDSHRASAAEGQSRAAARGGNRGRSRHRKRIDAVARRPETFTGAVEVVGAAVGIGHLPLQTDFQGRERDGWLHLLPELGIAVIGTREIELGVVLTNVAVDLAALPAPAVIGG